MWNSPWDLPRTIIDKGESETFGIFLWDQFISTIGLAGGN